MTKFCVAALLVAFSLLAAYHEVDAVCCGKPCDSQTCSKFGNKCNDCTNTTPYCGYGKCNIFGCNCDGGCRSGKGCMNCDCPRPPTYRQFSNMNSTPKKCVSRKVRQQVARDSEAHLDLIFERADLNGNDLLDLSETQEWFRKFHPMAMSRSSFNVEAEFKRLDTNNDGFISRDDIDQ